MKEVLQQALDAITFNKDYIPKNSVGQTLSNNAITVLHAALAQPAQPALTLAAQAVLDRWDSPNWDWEKQGPTALLMNDLRRAIAASKGAAT